MKDTPASTSPHGNSGSATPAPRGPTRSATRPGSPRRVILSGRTSSGTLDTRRRQREEQDWAFGIFSDQNGLVQRTGFQAAYSYHIWVQDYTQLSFGLAATGYHYIINADHESFRDPAEPWLTDNLRKGIFVPDINFGMYLMNDRYTLGFSAESLLGAAAKIGDGLVDTLKAYDRFRMSRHYYVFGSYGFPTAKNLEIEPSVLLKLSEQIYPQADMALTFIYDQTFWLGAGYRTGGFYGTSSQGAVIGMVRVRWGNMYLGYSYDYSLNEIESVTSGSHELVLALKLGSSNKKYNWLDRY